MLHLDRVSKAFGDRQVLDALSFDVNTGEIYGLLGPNGAGKTTTINLICHLLNIDSGSITLNGQIISHCTKALVGLAPQDNLLYRSLTCAENLDFFARIYCLSRQHRLRQIAHCLDAVNLSERANSVVSTLSGGMQRRLNIAIALIHNPQLVILDEPTTGLDIESRHDIWQLIRKLKQQNTAILLTTHMLEEAERLCNRIGILKAGAIAAEGSLDQLKELVSAREIVTISTEETERAIARAIELGWSHRFYGDDLALLLPEPLELRTLLERLADISLDSIVRQPVQLEHIYWEVAQSNKSPHNSFLSPT
ncbi:MAG: ABC transporter ATP-binding protein [Cyanobacteria bacterium P01_E01_bin.34]